ncbi:hypothetical protein ACFQ7W_00695 [Streptomyces niveus]|uniref:hypothetical protein n=1 Tax=Streptomyces niveus TaxID=193462 RepID=UPI00368CDDB6
MDQKYLSTPAPQSAPLPHRRLIAAGIIGRAAGRTVRTVRTQAGTTGAVTTTGQLHIQRQLRSIAQHLQAHRPADTMTEGARLAVALGITGSAPASRPVLAVLPFPARGVTRGEYALHVRKAAWPVGPVTGQKHDDDEDDACGLCGCWTCRCPKGGQA